MWIIDSFSFPSATNQNRKITTQSKKWCFFHPKPEAEWDVSETKARFVSIQTCVVLEKGTGKHILDGMMHLHLEAKCVCVHACVCSLNMPERGRRRRATNENRIHGRQERHQWCNRIILNDPHTVGYWLCENNPHLSSWWYGAEQNLYWVYMLCIDFSHHISMFKHVTCVNGGGSRQRRCRAALSSLQQNSFSLDQ